MVVHREHLRAGARGRGPDRVDGPGRSGPPEPDPAAGREGRERSLWSYLVVARPVDTGAKALVVPLAWLAVQLGGAGDGVGVGTAVVVWLVFELGLYEARYELNDLADADVDRAHVVARGRVTIDARARRWVRTAVVARLAGAGMALVVLPEAGAAVLAVAAVGLAGITAGYETARAAMRRRPLGSWRAARLSVRELAVFGLVGTGYALRAGVGAALAGVEGPTLAAIVGLGWAVGTLAVVMAWVDEAAALRLGGGHRVLAGKTHVALLARLLGDDRGRLARPLLRGAPARLTGGLLAVAGSAAVVFGAALGGRPGPVGLVLLLGLVVVAGPVVVAGWPSLWAGPAVVALYGLAGWVLAAGGGRLEMALVLAFVAAAPATTRAVDVSSWVPDDGAGADAGSAAAAPPEVADASVIDI